MCVMALDTTGKTAIGSVDLTGKTDVNMPNCDLYNDSPVAASTELAGSSSLSARNIFMSGGYSQVGGGTMTATGTVKSDTTGKTHPHTGPDLSSHPGGTFKHGKNKHR